MKRPCAFLLCVLLSASALSAAPRRERRMSIDVKDGDVRVIFSSVKEQCGIRNLIIDEDVSGKGTFLFREVPCGQAIRTITASLGLAAESEPAYLRVTSDR